ncbi:unnamed protein product [Allacma fusca]|uniref:Uncharacterized protein n=1 Tax=Allacma fusca TaxID=39272 RepID=A0A8J2LNJ9_9HEXA|nr:unnamed protein product [Allacma fusca]
MGKSFWTKSGRKNKVGHNWKGNGFQTGGTLIIEKGGERVILSYKMKVVADQLGNKKILESLNIVDDNTVPMSRDITTDNDSWQMSVCNQCIENVSRW